MQLTVLPLLAEKMENKFDIFEELENTLEKNEVKLQEGDIISIDCGALKNGFYGDHAYTFAVGEIDPATEKLLRITKESLYVGIDAFRAGNRIGD